VTEVPEKSIITDYLEYIGKSESPVTFHRWSFMTILGAFLGRNLSFKHGHFNIIPNMYIMLMGGPGTRKSTAIKIAAGVAKDAGYSNIAAERTTKEKFLMDLAGVKSEGETDMVNPDDIWEANIFGEEEKEDAEILVAADEFNVFVGNGNIDFLTLLGTLWDYEGKFSDRKKNSQSFVINNPTVSIIGGNTPTGFSLAFPIESIGQGIFSRMLMIHGETNGTKIAFPDTPDIEERARLIIRMQEVQRVAKGIAILSTTAKALLTDIYEGFKGIGDVRFESYANRRFTHLLKLCLIITASYGRTTITDHDVIFANTILTHAEHTMPKALGEYGKARHSDVAHKLIQYLEQATGIVKMKELWQQVHTDLGDISELKDMLSNMIFADKIMTANGGFLVKRKQMEEMGDANGFVDYSLLELEERRYIK